MTQQQAKAVDAVLGTLAMSPAAVVVIGAGLVIWSPLLLVRAVAAAKDQQDLSVISFSLASDSG